MNWTRRNYRKWLLAGIRDRIDREKFGGRLLILWSFLLDAAELPA